MFTEHLEVRIWLFVCVLRSFTSEVIYTLSTTGAVPYRYKLFRYSLDRYGPACAHTCSGTVPIHLSTLRTERTKLYRNSLFRNDPFKLLSLGSERNGTEWAIHLQIWTGGAVGYRSGTVYRSKNASMDRVLETAPPFTVPCEGLEAP